MPITVITRRSALRPIRSSGGAISCCYLPEQPKGTRQGWLALFAAEFPAAAHLALGLDTTSDTGADLAEFAAAGLDVRRETVLTASALREPAHRNRAALCRPLAGDGDWRQAARLQALCAAADGSPAAAPGRSGTDLMTLGKV